MIKLKNIIKTFDRSNNVVDNLNLNIHNGEFMVLIGESGCGKTTTMKMFTDEEMQELNLAVDEGADPKQVAEDILREKGLIQ